MDKIIINESNSDVITNLIELIEEFSVIIYKGENTESSRLLVSIIDKLELIVNFKTISENDHQVHIYELKNKLPELLGAFENNDKVLISDILQYEVKPLIKQSIYKNQ